MFPVSRPRRLRATQALRDLVAETRLDPHSVVAPLFVREGIDSPRPIGSLPGVVQHTRESLLREARELADLGVGAVIVFGIPSTKDSIGSQAFDRDGIVQHALRDLTWRRRRADGRDGRSLRGRVHPITGTVGFSTARGRRQRSTLEVYGRSPLRRREPVHTSSPRAG
jgi:hypothetical protein